MKEQMTGRKRDRRVLLKKKEVLEIKINVIKMENDFGIFVCKLGTQPGKEPVI